jgi:hypothetical protein
MDPVKAGTTQPVKAAEAPKPVAQAKKPEAQREATVAEKAPEQAPRPTTNTRGEAIGRLLNVSA